MQMHARAGAADTTPTLTPTTTQTATPFVSSVCRAARWSNVYLCHLSLYPPCASHFPSSVISCTSACTCRRTRRHARACGCNVPTCQHGPRWVGVCCAHARICIYAACRRWPTHARMYAACAPLTCVRVCVCCACYDARLARSSAHQRIRLFYTRKQACVRSRRACWMKSSLSVTPTSVQFSLFILKVLSFYAKLDSGWLL